MTEGIDRVDPGEAGGDDGGIFRVLLQHRVDRPVTVRAALADPDLDAGLVAPGALRQRPRPGQTQAGDGIDCHVRLGGDGRQVEVAADRA